MTDARIAILLAGVATACGVELAEHHKRIGAWEILGAIGHDLNPSLGGVWMFDPTIYLEGRMILLGQNVRIDSFCKIEGGTGVVIGECTHISSFSHIGLGGGSTWIGRHVGISSGVRVISGTHCMDAPSMSASSPRELQHVERMHVTVEDQAFLGAGCTVMPGVRVGRGAVVGAGALVTAHVPSWAIVAGVPARVIGTRHQQREL